ncbi:MAG: translation elongation factor Ts [Pedosphaera sp.]|nr:translation elongation factor Ts [Pedosphaera sp.]
MSQITAEVVNNLRQRTGAGIMDCKKALVETSGDVNAAVDLLRKRGVAVAAKKAGRAATDGVITQYIQPGAKTGLLVEINCETDFVAKNDIFRQFCDEITKTLSENPAADLEPLRVAVVAKVGENILISRHERYQVDGNGAVAAYIHLGNKIGVLVEVGAGNEATLQRDEFKSAIRDITVQVAAGSPLVVSREQLDPKIIEKEREIAAAQMKDKPPQAMAKIIEGKLEKYYQSVCLVDQGFVKRNSEVSLSAHLAAIGKVLGDTISVRRFTRFQVGETVGE